MSLQLGTKGSRSKIMYGCTAPYRFGQKSNLVDSPDYFDIANVDRYDVVLGTVFMRKHGIALDFQYDTVCVRGECIPTISEGEDIRELTRRYAKNVQTDIHIRDKEKIEVRQRPKKYGVVKNSPEIKPSNWKSPSKDVVSK